MGRYLDDGPNCQCWNEGQWGRVHTEECPIHQTESDLETATRALRLIEAAAIEHGSNLPDPSPTIKISPGMIDAAVSEIPGWFADYSPDDNQYCSPPRTRELSDEETRKGVREMLEAALAAWRDER
jgi:hypothetical protein